MVAEIRLPVAAVALAAAAVVPAEAEAALEGLLALGVVIGPGRGG